MKELKAEHRGHEHSNHLAAVSEMVPAIAWVAFEGGQPCPFIKDMIAAGQFYSNRVLKDFRTTSVLEMETVLLLIMWFGCSLPFSSLSPFSPNAITLSLVLSQTIC